MRALLILVFWLAASAILGATVAAAEAEQAEQAAIVLRIQLQDEAITPVTARFIERALREGERTGCQCLVIELDTPGGLLQSTQEIVRAILASRIPVIVYVTPAGGRAASAGLFITLSSDVAAMAPGTRIGAAHPVQLGGLPIGPNPPEEPEEAGKPDSDRGRATEEKLVNDTEASARGLAQMRGRNASWAALAVTESRVILASEAVEQGVVELEAVDLDDLLQKLDGREVWIGKMNVRLRTADARVETLQMWWGEKFLAVISNPNMVIFLLMFGFYGVLFELYSPGWGVAGTLGVVSLVLAFFGMSILPVNYAGLALIMLALAMFVAEVKVTSFGALTMGGVICLVLGGMMLVDSPSGFFRVSLGVLVPIAVATGLITVFLLSGVLRAHRSKVQTGGEALLHREAVAREGFLADDSGFHGQVFIHGELWRARSSAPVACGAIVRVTGRDGLTLNVEPNHQTDLAVSERS